MLKAYKHEAVLKAYKHGAVLKAYKHGVGVLKAYKHGAGVLKAYKHEAGCFDHKAVVILNTGTLGLYLNGSIYYFIVFKRIVLEWNAKLIAKAIGLQDTVLPPPTHESTLSDNIKQRHWQAPLTKLVQDRQNQQTN